MPGLIRLLLVYLLSIAGPPAIAADGGFVSTFGLQFVPIRAGQFIMGTQDFETLGEWVGEQRIVNLRKEGPAHRVVISRDFFMATTETTQAVWHRAMGTRPGKEERWQRDDWQQIPVSRVSWEGVQLFLEAVNQMDDRFLYRLPSEAEWEYAARAGTTGLRPFALGQLDSYAWFQDSSNDEVQPVATRKPNAWGLYDVIGNLWEWVHDSYDRDYYDVSPTIDPPGPAQSSFKVMRGGSYHCEIDRARVGIRVRQSQDRQMSVLGFRLVAEPR